MTSGQTATTTAKVYMGVGIFPTGMDNADFPDLSKYDGDWLWWTCKIFTFTGIDVPVLPDQVAGFDVDSKAQRKITDVGLQPWFVCQSDTTTDLRVRVDLAMMLLLP